MGEWPNDVRLRKDLNISAVEYFQAISMKMLTSVRTAGERIIYQINFTTISLQVLIGSG